MENFSTKEPGEKSGKIVWDGFIRRIVFLLVGVSVVATFFVLFDLKKIFTGEKIEQEIKKEKADFKEANEINSNDETAVEENLILKCESELWVKIEEFDEEKKSFLGKFSSSQVEEGSEKKFWLDKEKRLIVEKEEIADFFEEKEVEILGARKEESIEVAEIRCRQNKDSEGGVEDPDFRNRAMKYVGERLHILSPIAGSWQAKNFSWPKKEGLPENEYIFVQFEGQKKGSIELAVHLLLLKVFEEEGKMVVENVAFFKQGDSDWELVRGENIFDEIKIENLYVFEEGLDMWIKVD